MAQDPYYYKNRQKILKRLAERRLKAGCKPHVKRQELTEPPPIEFGEQLKRKPQPSKDDKEEC